MRKVPTDPCSPPLLLTLRARSLLLLLATVLALLAVYGLPPLPVALADAPTNTILFNEPFAYANGAIIDQVVGTPWRGRYAPPDASAVAQNGQARLNGWRTLSTLATYLNKRDAYTHVAVDLIGASGMNYTMVVGAYGVNVSYDGANRVSVRSNNLGYSPSTNSQGFKVVSAAKSIHVDLYLRDQESQVFITDDQGVQATPLWLNRDMFGNIAYGLSLGYAGSYDNVLIEYTTNLPPTLPAARAPVLVTTGLVEGVINKPYMLPQAEWMIAQGIIHLQQIRADGGVAPLAYTITSNNLPPGLTFTTVHTQPTSDMSPPQWVGVLAGTPTQAGIFPLDVKVTDAQGRADTLRYSLTVVAQAPPPLAFHEEFTGADGSVIHDKLGSQWTGRYGASTVSAVYTSNRARINTWMLLKALPVFRNAKSRYLHAGVQVFQGVGGTMKLNCGGEGFGLVASYDGNRTVQVSSNNLGYGPQMIVDTLTITPSANAAVTLDVYLKGADTRVYVTNEGRMQATEVRNNSRLVGACENGDYTLTLGYAGLYDNVVVEDVPLLPELYNPVRIVTEAVLQAYQGVTYTDVLTATAGKPPYAWSATGLPAGLTLTSAGALTGKPTVPGTYPVVFTVTDALRQRADLPFNLPVEADPEGTLLFADRFTLPAGLWLAARDDAHWASLPHTPYALTYGAPPSLLPQTGEGGGGVTGWLTVQAHKQGALKVAFPNDGVTPLAFRWRMTKGRYTVQQVNTCWGMQVEYDGIQRITLRWNDMCYEPYLVEQSFLLESLNEAITAQIEVKGQAFGLRLEDSKQTYLRGPYTARRVQVGQPLTFIVRDNTPYGEGRYTSYQAGNSYIDDLTVRRGVWTVANSSPLRNKEELGRLLFFDPLLSGDNRRACASCHRPELGFADGLTRTLGLNGAWLARNTPGLTNLALFDAFFWDGRELNAKSVALHPIQSGLEMNQALPELVNELAAIPAYQATFSAIWPSDGVTAQHTGEALAAYVRTLMELRTGYDANLYRQGTLTADEDAGMILFNGKANCTRCHTLPPVTAVGSTVYSTPVYKIVGVPGNAAGTQLDGDIGREAVTGNPADRGAFRVPSLRNLTRTAPYMHNGVFATLEEVVNFYNRGGGRGVGLPVPNQAVEITPLGLTDTEQRQLVAFLRALSSQFPSYVAIPTTVPSNLPVGGVTPQTSATGAGIIGQVTAENGAPLPNVQIVAYQQGFSGSWPITGAARTDADGNYTIANLSAGNFRIYFLDPAGVHGDRYYPNAAAFTDAATVVVTADTSTPNINGMLAGTAPITNSSVAALQEQTTMPLVADELKHQLYLPVVMH